MSDTDNGRYRRYRRAAIENWVRALEERSVPTGRGMAPDAERPHQAGARQPTVEDVEPHRTVTGQRDRDQAAATVVNPSNEAAGSEPLDVRVDRPLTKATASPTRTVVGFMSGNQQDPDTICEVFVLAPTDLVDGDELEALVRRAGADSG